MMTRTDRFGDMAAFLSEKRRLIQKRDLHAARIAQHWEALKDKDVRTDLANNAIHDLLGLWKPTRFLSSLFSPGSLGTSLSMSLGGGKGGWPKRAALFALGLIAPGLIGRIEKIDLENVAHEVGVSVDRIRDHLRSRKQARAAQAEANDETD